MNKIDFHIIDPKIKNITIYIMISDLAESLLKYYENNKKIKIIKLYTGKKAYKYAVNFFFSDGDVPKFKSKDIQKSLFFVYIRKKITKKYIGFKYVIGENTDPLASVVGEEHDYETGKKMLKNF